MLLSVHLWLKGKFGKKNFFSKPPKKIVRVPPYDFGWKIVVAKSKNSLKNQNVRSNHEERRPQMCLNIFSLSVIKERNPPLPSRTHCTLGKNRKYSSIWKITSMAKIKLLWKGKKNWCDATKPVFIHAIGLVIAFSDL